jgi:thymidine phosphorylase
MDKGAGVDLYRKLGDRVESGDMLYRVYAEYAADEQFARVLTADNHGYTFGDLADLPRAFVPS